MADEYALPPIPLLTARERRASDITGLAAGLLPIIIATTIAGVSEPTMLPGMSLWLGVCLATLGVLMAVTEALRPWVDVRTHPEARINEAVERYAADMQAERDRRAATLERRTA